MRLLGVDFGTVRTGLAIGETDPFFVEPLLTLKEKVVAEAAKQIAEMTEREGVEMIVVGRPTALHGHAGGQTLGVVEEFVTALSALTDRPVVLEDERFSTALADRLHREYGVTSGKKFDRDAVSAAVILESYIERRRAAERSDRQGDVDLS